MPFRNCPDTGSRRLDIFASGSLTLPGGAFEGMPVLLCRPVVARGDAGFRREKHAALPCRRGLFKTTQMQGFDFQIFFQSQNRSLAAQSRFLDAAERGDG